MKIMNPDLTAIAEKFSLKLIILFGSVAMNRQTPISDTDILIASQHSLSLDEEGELRAALSQTLHILEDTIDLVSLHRAGGLLRMEIFTKGKLLYGSPMTYEIEKVRALRKFRDEQQFAQKHRHFFKEAFEVQ